MAGKGVKAGSAYVEITSDDSALKAGLVSAQAKLEAFGSTIQGIGAKLMAVSATILTPIAAGTQVYADFEKQMANVSTMLSKPEAHMKGFTSGVRDMAVQFGESTEALSKGLYDILSASVAPSQAMEVLAVSTKAAKAGLSDAGIAADAITTILNSYGLSADRAADISDLLFKIVVRGKVTFEELASGIGNVANIAHTGGISLEEMGAVLALLTRNGIKSDEAITALRGIMASFISPSVEAAAVGKELGIELSTTTLKTEGLYGVFKKLSKLPPEVIGKLFPEIRALKGVLSVVADMKGFGEDMAVMASRAGATEEAYAKMSGTIVGGFNKIKESVTGIFSLIGEAMAGGTKQFITQTLAILSRVREWVNANQELIPTIARVGVYIGIAGAAFVAIGTVISAAAIPLGVFAAIVTAIGTAFGVLVSAVGALFSPLGLAAAAIAAFGIQFLTLPPMISAALSMIAARVGVFWATIRALFLAGVDVMRALWIGHTVTINRAWQNLTIQMGMTWLTLSMGMRGVWETLTSALLTSWNAVQSAVVTAWGVLKDLWAVLSATISAAWAGDTEKMLEAWTTFTTKTGTLWAAVQTVIDGLWVVLKQKWDTLTAALVTVLDRQLAKMGTSWRALSGVVQNFLTRVIGLWNSHGEALLGVARDVILFIGYLKLFAIASAAIAPIWASMAASITAGIAVIIALCNPWALAFAAIVALVIEIAVQFYKMVPVVKTTIDRISKYWEGTWGATKDVLAAGFQFLQDAFSGSTEKMKTSWGKFTNKLDDLWRMAWKSLSASWIELTNFWARRNEILEQEWNVFTNAVLSLWQRVWPRLVATWKEVEPTFNRIVVQSLESAWNKLWDWMLDKVIDVMADVIGAIDSALRRLDSFMTELLGLSSYRIDPYSLPRNRGVNPVSPNLSALTQQLQLQVAGVSPSFGRSSSFSSSSASSARQSAVDDRIATASEESAKLLKTLIKRVDAMEFRLA